MGRGHDTAGAMAFQVHKDIRNRPLRELDRVGQRRMWGATVVALGLLCLLMAAVWLRVEQIDLGYRIEELKVERAHAEAERRHLQAELESLRAPKRIEALATQRLHLVDPTGADAFVIERVRTSNGPSGAVVAQR
jgi:cell division protein FtsL